MSTFIDKGRMYARRDGIEMTIDSDDQVSVNLILSNEALYNLVEFITEKAPQQFEMMKRIIQKKAIEEAVE